ncbi:MAG: hypothetical protein ABWY28_09200, partial [Pseudomonas prosekii]
RSYKGGAGPVGARLARESVLTNKVNLKNEKNFKIRLPSKNIPLIFQDLNHLARFPLKPSPTSITLQK